MFTVADLAQRARVGSRETLLSDATPGQVEESFRRARGLLTADQLEAWLAEWHVDPDDFRRWTEDVVAGTATSSDWCACLCSGTYEAVVAAVVTAAAAACELGQPPRDPALFEPAGWTERLLAAKTTRDLLAAAVGENRLDWIRLRVCAAHVPSRAIAEELRHQVLHDGIDLSAAAVRAGFQTEELESARAAFTPAVLQSALAGAQRGDVVGPLPTGAIWLVVQVLERTDPAVTDPATRALAEQRVHADLIAQAVARHIVT